MSGLSADTALWYASRATGVVCLLLMTAVVLLGVLVTRQGRLPGLPRFAVTGLHRNLSLLAVLFLAIHVVTAILDPFVTIGWAATVVPLASPYRPVWIGLGAVALDLMAALVLTSLARARIGRRAWRAVHWLAYACWPLSLAHSLGSSGDLRSGPLLWLSAACAAAVAAALAVRALAGARQLPPAGRAAVVLADQEAAARRKDAVARRGPAARQEDLLARRHAVLGGQGPDYPEQAMLGNREPPGSQETALARRHAALTTRAGLAARESGR
jgi:predicted ferric reductase